MSSTRREVNPSRRQSGARERRGARAIPQGAPATTAAVRWRAVLIVAVGVLTYGNSLSGPFVYDDIVSIVDNQPLHEWWHPIPALFPARELPIAGRPMPSLSLVVNYMTGGLDVRGYHAMNIAFHLFCALLVFGIVRRTLEVPKLRERFGGQSLNLACAVALIWTVHPLNTEVVDYVTERTESMMAVFYLLTMYASIRAQVTARSAGWVTLAIISCVFGMACKESMASAPVMVLLYDRIFVFKSVSEGLRARGRFYAGLAATWVLLTAFMWSGPRVRSTGFSIGITPWTYLLNQAIVITHYLLLTVWPRALVLMYGAPLPLTVGDVLPYALLVTALVVLSLAALIWWPMIGFLGAWFFITLAPASSIVPISTEVGAERRMYLPLVALVVLGVIGAEYLWKLGTRSLSARGIVATAAAGTLGGVFVLFCVSSALAARTVVRNREFSSALSLAWTVLERWPTGLAERLVGEELCRSGRPEEGVTHLRMAIKQGESRAHYDLGVQLFKDRKLDDSIDELQTFVREEPLLFEVIAARTTMGQAFMLQQKWPQATEQFRLLLGMMPSSVSARVLLADALFAQQEYDEAVVHYREYVKAGPADVAALTRFGVALEGTGKTNEAIAAFRQAVDLQPQNADARRNLATALFDEHDTDGAAVQAEQAVALNPRDPAARDLLGRTLAIRGRFEEARAEFLQALQIDPAFGEARADLQRLIQGAGPARRLQPDQSSPR